MSYESDCGTSAKSRGAPDGQSAREKSEREGVVNLGLALIVIPLMSLALWWAILSVVWPVVLALLE